MKRAYLSLLLLLVPVPSAIGQQTAAAGRQQSSQVASGNHTSATAENIWADLMEGNKRFMAGRSKAGDLVALRTSLVKGQQPKVVVLACSDSRVAPELLFDKNLGDLFVVRSAGNIADEIGVGSIEYAVEHLGSSVLLVLGHTGCGAVTAACSGDKMPTAGLQAIVDKIAPAVLRERKVGVKGDTLVESAIKENVRQSAKDVLKNSELLRDYVQQGKLTLFEAEYQMDTGEVIRLDAAAQ